MELHLLPHSTLPIRLPPRHKPAINKLLSYFECRYFEGPYLRTTLTANFDETSHNHGDMIKLSRAFTRHSNTCMSIAIHIHKYFQKAGYLSHTIFNSSNSQLFSFISLATSIITNSISSTVSLESVTLNVRGKRQTNFSSAETISIRFFFSESAIKE